MARTPPRRGEGARRAVFEALSGRSGADVSGAAGGDISALLRAAFGVSPTRANPNRPDYKAAAAALGRSERTVRRYAAQPGQQRITPRPETLKTLTTKARQAATTKRGRAAAVKATRAARAPSNISVTVRGSQGVSPEYARQRTITMNLDPDLANGYFQAYVDRGEDGALDFLTNNCQATYHIDRWHFGSVDDMSIGGPYGRDF